MVDCPLTIVTMVVRLAAGIVVELGERNKGLELSAFPGAGDCVPTGGGGGLSVIREFEELEGATDCDIVVFTLGAVVGGINVGRLVLWIC